MNSNDILQDLKAEKIKLYELEEHLNKAQAVEVRRTYLEEKLGVKLPAISKYPFDPEKIYRRNCENVIGGVSLPLGIAGPVKVNGEEYSGEFYIPMATTEGTLVASVNRGIRAINEAGGSNVISNYVGITRAPLFRLKNIKESQKFIKWFSENYEEIKKIGDETDPFVEISKYETFSNGRNVWIRFNFNTGDAMGMNMAVVACQAMANWIERNFEGVKTLTISGNMCIDKKPGAINIIEGRGRIVEAEVILNSEVVKKYLKSTVDDMIEVNHAKTWLGSAMAGSLGFNAHAANMIAAIFIATGQDPAHVVEGSLASTNMERQGEDLYVNVRIPSLNIATVGGGTNLATQRECQDIMLAGLDMNQRTNSMAGVIATAVLAGELSLHAAMVSGTFVKAHEDLGR